MGLTSIENVNDTCSMKKQSVNLFDILNFKDELSALYAQQLTIKILFITKAKVLFYIFYKNYSKLVTV